MTSVVNVGPTIGTLLNEDGTSYLNSWRILSISDSAPLGASGNQRFGINTRQDWSYAAGLASNPQIVRNFNDEQLQSFLISLRTSCAWNHRGLVRLHLERLRLEKLLQEANDERERLAQANQQLLKEKEEQDELLDNAEQSARHVAERAIERENQLKNEHRDAIGELTARHDHLQETKGQLEERVRTHEAAFAELQELSSLREENSALRVELIEAKRSFETLPDAPELGPWERVKTPKLAATNLDEHCNEILEQAQLLLLDPLLFPSIWKERTGKSLTKEEEEAWGRTVSPF